MSHPRWVDRFDAGKALAARLAPYAGRDDLVVVGLTRGGMPVAAAVARELRAPLEALVVYRLTVPGEERLPMAVMVEGGVLVRNDEAVSALQIPTALIWHEVQRAAPAIRASRVLFHEHREPIALTGKTVILVDDYVETGLTVRAALRSLRLGSPREVVVAAPVAAEAARSALGLISRRFVGLETLAADRPVESFFERFEPVAEADIRPLLDFPLEPGPARVVHWPHLALHTTHLALPGPPTQHQPISLSLLEP